MEISTTPRSLTPNYPSNSQVCAFLRVMNGVSKQHYREMENRVWEQAGIPQATQDWSRPEEWIPSRLTGKQGELALNIWHSSDRVLNPRHTRGSWYFCRRHGLIEENSDGKLTITPAGQSFLDYPQDGKQAALIDEYEGIFVILKCVKGMGAAQKRDILPDYQNFCNIFTNTHSEYPQKVGLSDRLRNLVERKALTRTGPKYRLTVLGERLISNQTGQATTPPISNNIMEIYRLTAQVSRETREHLEKYLSQMNPTDFEYLIGRLLEEMGYANVRVTKRSGDKGIDVLGDIELGISSVHEAVQVKRWPNRSVQPDTVNQLRGSLPHYGAIRGTIITLGRFTPGSESAALPPGGSPITLIDGEKLLDLLIKFEIGTTRKTIEYDEFNERELTNLTPNQPELL